LSGSWVFLADVISRNPALACFATLFVRPAGCGVSLFELWTTYQKKGLVSGMVKRWREALQQYNREDDLILAILKDIIYRTRQNRTRPKNKEIKAAGIPHQRGRAKKERLQEEPELIRLPKARMI
jgi:hypothetical protein